MLRHIVLVKIIESKDITKISAEFKEKLLGLTDTIDDLKNMEVGLNINTGPSAFDLSLIADFEDEAGLNKYRMHPDHVLVLDFMKKVVEKTAVVDYII